MNQPDLPAHFEWFADWAADSSPLYATLARRIANDPDLLALADLVPPDRSPANVLLAAVHSLLLDGAEHPLRRYYPTCVDGAGEARQPDESAGEALQSFCAEHRQDLVDRLTTRRTQTNAVRRCTALLPAFEHLARQFDRRPMALVEVGPSAGLNLYWDRYGYEYERSGGGRTTGRASDGSTTTDRLVAGDASSGVRLTAELRGAQEPPLPGSAATVPPVASRVGLDLNPLDVTDAADVTWLLALVWPEHTDRHELLRAAIDVAREDPPELRAGDALEALPTAVDEVPADTPVVVFDTQVRYQFDEATDGRYRELVRDLGRGRELHWLSGHHVADHTESGFWLRHSRVDDGRLVEENLAAYEQHGRWVEWVAGE